MLNDADIEMIQLRDDANRISAIRNGDDHRVRYSPAAHYSVLRAAWFEAAMAYTAATPLIIEALADHGVSIDDSQLFDAMGRAKAEWDSNAE